MRWRFLYPVFTSPSVSDVDALDCVFDRAPDGTPKGASYIKALEERNALLESRLEGARSKALLQDHATVQDVESCEQPGPSLNVTLDLWSDLALLHSEN